MAGHRAGVALALLAALTFGVACGGGGGQPPPQTDYSSIPIAHPTGSTFEIPAQGIDGPAVVKVEVIRAGNGKPAQKGSLVTFNYKANAVGKPPYDSTENHGGPRDARAGFGSVLPGWDAAIQQMRVGDAWKLTIPPGLGMGKNGGPGIPPNSTIEVECEVIAVE
jgi:peptidylprolyl isomerase